MRYPVRSVADRAWELQESVGDHAACFLALAEVLDCPLVTCDGWLASASAHHANVEVFSS